MNDLYVGYVRQLPARIVFDVAYVNRLFRQELGNVDINVVYENGLFRGYLNPAFNTITLRTNLRNSERRYQSFELSVIRNIGARWHLFASYTYQRTVLDGEFALDDPDRYLHPASWFRDDRLSRPHILRLNGSADLRWGITAAVIYSAQSGAFGLPLIRNLPAADPTYGPPTLTLSNGRRVTNPLSTIVRLVGPSGDEKLQAPTIHRLNVRFGKAFRFGSGHALELNIDVFNLANAGAPLFFRAGANNISTETFGQFQSTTQSPRGGQLSVRYRF
jgi:hypothetical protein